MYDDKTKTHFIMLRSQGWSITRVSEHLHVSRPTLIKWNEDYHCMIRSFRAVELEALHESILAKHQEEIARLSKQQQAIARELAKRKLSKVSTERLYSLDALLRAEIQKIRTLSAPIQEDFDIPSPEHPLVRYGLVGTPGFPEKVAPVPPALSPEPETKTRKPKRKLRTSTPTNPPPAHVGETKSETNGNANSTLAHHDGSNTDVCHAARHQLDGDPLIPAPSETTPASCKETVN